MSAAPGDSSAVTLLASIADPAVIVDADGLLIAWNPAAQSWLGLAEDVSGRPIDALAGARTHSARRLALADSLGAALLVWSVDGDGLGPDDIALEKLDIIGRLAGGVRHDLMNHLGAVMGFAELQEVDARMPADVRELNGQIRQAAQRIKLMSHTMLDFSRGAPPQPRRLAVGPLTRDVVELLNHATKDMQVRVLVPDGLPEVEADPREVPQALLALILNALEAQGATWAQGANPVPGRLRISGSAIDDARGNRVRLAIEDGGPVVPADERPTLFSGVGPGRAGRDLAVAKALVERAGGRVSYEPVLNGNRIVVELPVAGTTLPPGPELGPEPEAVEAGPPFALICDPQPLIRTLLVRFTSRLGIMALEARDGREAMAILAEQPVALVIADLGVGGDGEEFYDEVVALRPELATRFLLLSADPGNATVAEFARRTGVPIVPKPFDNGMLNELVRDAIER